MSSYTLLLDGQKHLHFQKIKTIDPKTNLLTTLAADPLFPKFYWQQNGEEIAALGSILQLKTYPNFDPKNTSPARLFGGHHFFPNNLGKNTMWKSFPPIAFFLPRFEIRKTHDKILLIQNALDTPLDEDLTLHKSPLPTQCQTLQNHLSHCPNQTKWLDQIAQLLEKIQSTPLDKVVMGRCSSYQAQVNPFSLLKTRYSKGSIAFAVAFEEGTTFIGSTPETLYRRDGLQIQSEAIAGTRKRGKDPQEDALLEQELLQSKKERHEFLKVKTSIEIALKPLTTSLKWQSKDHIVRTPNVQHLKNTIEGELKYADDKAILQALHPTAAMGGFPKELALDHLVAEEGFDRGWYASALGYCSSHQAHFGVGIRSALVQKEKVHLFVGAGIVEGSVPSLEWEELNYKMSLWK